MFRLNLFGAFSLADSNGVEIPLKSRKAKALLAYLALSPNKSRSREKIMALLWSNRGEAQARASLRQVLAGLRKELGESGEALLHINNDTVTMNPENLNLLEANGEEFLDGLHISDPAFDEWLRDERLRLDVSAKVDIKPPEPPVSEMPSIAVLPFKNMSNDPDQDFFSDGITQDIIVALSKIPRLIVIARDSSFTYKGRTVDVAQVGNEQGVKYVLEGSVRRGGERLRIIAQLVDASTGQYIWGQRYDRVIEGLFELQDEITREVISALQVKLTQGEQARILIRGTINHEAWELLVQTEELLNSHRKEDALKGRRLAERALELDNSYDSAWSCLGWSHLSEVFNGWSEDQTNSLDVALNAANRARDIDETNPETFALIGFIELCRRNFDQAIQYGQQAITLGPSNAEAFGIAATIEQYCNNPENAISLLRKSMRFCPIYPAWYADVLGWTYLSMHRHNDAITAAQDAIRIDADFLYSYLLLALAYAELGRKEEAIAAVAKIRRLVPGYTLRTFAKTQPFRDTDVMQRYLEGLAKAGLPR